MKRFSFHIWLPVILGGLLFLYGAARITGLLSVYSMPTVSMEPNYPVKSMVFATRLFSLPGRNEVVAYKDSNIAFLPYREAKEEIYLGRVVATEGEQVEVKNGHTYVNGECSDKGLRLLFGWQLSESEYRNNLPRFKDVKKELIERAGNNVIVYMEEKTSDDLLHKKVALKQVESPLLETWGIKIWGAAGAQWSCDDFGPVVVPPGHIFIMCDNRHNSEDSRMRGFVPQDKVLSKAMH